MDQKMTSKVTYGMERIAEAIQALLWEKAKVYGLSPIQIKILFFVANHKASLCHVSHLAREFNLTKPTISDAVRVLHKKGWMEKDHSSSDSRSYTLFLTPEGKQLIEELNDYTDPVGKALEQLDPANVEQLYTTLLQIIDRLNRKGVLQVQRTCLGCRFHERRSEDHFCHFLQSSLNTSDLQVDCEDFEAVAS